MSKYLVLSIKPYDFQNDKGERVAGAKLAYINRKPSSRDNEQGHPPLLVTINDQRITKNITEVPGIYDLEFEQVTGRNNKPELILTQAELLNSIDFQEIFD